MAGQPQANAGQPGQNPGQPGNPAAPGQPQANAGQSQGQPGAMAGQPGQPAGQGQPAGAAPPAAPADAGTQVATAGLDSAASSGTTPGTGGVLSGEQNDGMTDTPEENLVAADNTETTGFDTPENHASPDMPSGAVGGDKKGIPGALILPPSPPMGTDTGKDPTPHPVKTNILTRATGKTAALISPPTETTPVRRAVAPRKAVPLPVGMLKKPDAKAVPPALTIGSTSQRGTVPMVVLTRPHLALGTVADTIDPPLPPAKGTPRARTVARHQDAVRPLTAQQTPMPTESAPPTESIKKTPPLVRQVKNSQGIKDGTEQPLPPTPLPDSDMEIGDGSGLKGDYYEGRRFDQFQFTKADANVNFVFTDMPGNSPSPKIAAGSDYTIRWTGKIAARFSETYTFYATVDDGVRVWINHKLIIDDWTLHAAMEFSNKFTFQAGEQYPIKVEYLESAGGAALIHLYWSSPSQPKEFIPEDAFFYPLPSDEQDLKRDKAPL